MPLHIVNGDILDLKADAIVIPVVSVGGTMHLMSGTASRVARAVGGNFLSRALESVDNITERDIAVIKSLSENYSYMIFASVPRGRYDEQKSCTSLRFACIKAMRWAEDHRLKSVCFPLVGGTKYGKDTMTAAIATHMRHFESCIDAFLAIPPACVPESGKPAPSPAPPTGEFAIITGDILQYPSEAIFIPVFERSLRPPYGAAKRVLTAAGREACAECRKKTAELTPGRIYGIAGYDLDVKYIVLSCFPDLREKDPKKWEMTLRRICIDAVRFAVRYGLNSITLALMADNILDDAEEIMVRTISGILEMEDSMINVFLVKPPKRVVKYVDDTAPEISGETSPKAEKAENYEDSYEQFDRRFEEAVKVSKLSKEEYCRRRLRHYLYNRIKNADKLAEEIDYNKGSICKFRSGKIVKPQKHRIIAMAIGMGLSDEERYEFIRCAGYQYPEDERDRLVESLIHSGMKTFHEINDRLSEVDPDFMLDRPGRSQTAAVKQDD